MQTQAWQKCRYSMYTVRSYVCWLYERGTPTKTECCCMHSSAAREEGGENRHNCEYVTLSRQTSSTRIAKHRSFIKLKFLQNFCSSCKTLADQVARNPRFYCIRHIWRVWKRFHPIRIPGFGKTRWVQSNWRNWEHHSGSCFRTFSVRGFRNFQYVYGFCSLFYGSYGIGVLYGALVVSNAPAGVSYIVCLLQLVAPTHLIYHTYQWGFDRSLKGWNCTARLGVLLRQHKFPFSSVATVLGLLGKPVNSEIRCFGEKSATTVSA